MDTIFEDLSARLRSLRFGPPVTHVYNPLEYACASYGQYLQRYATPPKEIVFLGMNPGPWGMAQTGVPFGEVKAVREWLGIEAPVRTPPHMHPKRPVLGFACTRREVSGQRLWGWAQKTFATPERFFARIFVANYCPLLFLEATGRNRTPNKLRASEREPLLAACDQALRRFIRKTRPRFVVGVGQFAEESARRALNGLEVRIGGITHPSPANPKANRGWDAIVTGELRSLGIEI
ncbi:MAG: single-stranded DNA-binding protein [Desulfobacterales bacterium]|nr:MAG: single-stranded DNA-binding protein [Desulfobacterales bacterium]